MDRKMKVLCFHPALAPYRVDFFNLLADRCDFKLALMLENLRTQRFDQDSLRKQLHFPVEYVKRISLFSRDIPVGCIRKVRKSDVDLVIGYECSPITLLLLVARMVGVIRTKVWTSMDDSPDLIVKRTGLRAIVRNWVLRHVDGVIVPSALAETAYRQVLPMKTDRSRPLFAVIPIIHDLHSIRKDEHAVFDLAKHWREDHLAANETAVFFVGRFTAVKNLFWLISQTADSRWPVHHRLFLVGDGELREELERQVSELHIQDRVSILDREEGCRLQAYFAAADLFVLTSYSEPFGAVVAEALQWGGPVLVSNKVGAKSLVEKGKNGAVYALDDASDFFAKLGEISLRSQTWRAGRPSRLSIELSQCINQYMEMVK